MLLQTGLATTGSRHPPPGYAPIAAPVAALFGLVATGRHATEQGSGHGADCGAGRCRTLGFVHTHWRNGHLAGHEEGRQQPLRCCFIVRSPEGGFHVSD